MSDFIAIPAITVLVYVAAEIFKVFAAEAAYRHIPVLCGALGVLFGTVCFLLIPGYIPAENAFVAAAIGAVSGWAATGANQSWKQETRG